MGFIEERFPTDINWSSEGGPGFATNVVVMDSGQEERVQRRTQSRRVYNAAYNVRTPNTVSVLQDFYLAVGGLSNGFRYKDWFDYNSTSVGRDWGDSESPGSTPADTDQVIGTGDGSTTTFQLVKRYVYGSTSSEPRTILKPVEDSVVVSVDDVSQASGWTVDVTTGIVTFSSAPNAGKVIKAGFEFDVPVRFGEGLDKQLPVRLDDHGNASVASVPIEELLSPATVNEDFCYGGSLPLALSFDDDITLNLGTLVWELDPSTSGLKATLPDISAASHPRGGPFLVLFNVGGDSVSIRNSSDVEVVALASGASTMLFIGKTSGSVANAWRAFG